MKSKYAGMSLSDLKRLKELEKEKKKATIYSSCIQHIRYHVKKRYCYKKLSGSFIANISVSVNLKN